ncbi:hypothetical protein KIN20_006654 [Parelaphostrongylus tenuis]|uniref:Uncharacterized protein n=1 Tax=Parelaphostrongylus tenuis TaxID=148309 RepID=A0AAD5MMW1_PARTN|nr:hypothetical protein KIN20_006654 [Parelaphostrongylus tenuis]
MLPFLFGQLLRRLPSHEKLLEHACIDPEEKKKHGGITMKLQKRKSEYTTYQSDLLKARIEGNIRRNMEPFKTNIIRLTS